MTRTSAAAAAAVVLALASPTGAFAQEWSGFYLGANLGGAWGNSDADAVVGCPATGYLCVSGLASAPNGPAVASAGSGSLDASGIIGGGQAGYNAQSGSLVYGFEVDLSALDLSGSRQGTANYPVAGFGAAGNTFTIGSSVSSDWLFTARGRIGWAMSNVLLYATGGVAVTDLEVTSTFRDNIATVGFTPGASMFTKANDTKVGYVVGGGAEWVVTGNWTLRGEYLFVDFGSVTTSGYVINPDVAGRATPVSMSNDLREHVGRAAINYKIPSSD